MKACTRFLITVMLLVTLTTGARAQQTVEQVREPDPGAAISAVVWNFIYLPVRLVMFVVGGELGGLTGFMTAGNLEAAHDIWGVFDGQGVISPEIVRGEEPIRVGQTDIWP